MSKKKKTLFIIFLVVVIPLAGVGWFFQDQIVGWFRPSGKKTSPLGVQDEKEVFNFDWALWEDPAGFSFEYPRELEVDIHVEDEKNYSFLTLTSRVRGGKIDIICNDSQYADIEEWLKEDSLVKQGSGLDTKIASVSGQRVALGNNREIAAFIDWDEVTYVIDKQAEEELDFWSEIYNHILSSFTLIPLEGETEEEFSQWLGGFDTAGVDVVEAVEVIE